MTSIDILLIGGTVSAISAALELKRLGYSVLVTSHRSFPGEDLCDSLRLALPKDLNLQDPLAKRLYEDAVTSSSLLRPMHIKRELDRVLAEADIPVLLNTAPAELHFEKGVLTGVSLHNRSGTRRVACSHIIDGTLRGDIARLAGIPLTPPDPSFPVIRRVIGGSDSAETSWTSEGEVEFPGPDGTVRAPLWEHHSTGSLVDASWAAWMTLEQQTRMAAYRRGQDMSADGIFAITGERLHPDDAPFEASGDLTRIPDHAVSALNSHLWFTGTVANVDPLTRDSLLRHDHCITWGKIVASRLHASLSDIPLPTSSISDLPPPTSDLRPPTSDLRPPTSDLRPPISVDILVVGGGTGGAPAAIAAARSGKSTLVAEFLSGLGGVGTLGLIGKYWYGNQVGFTAEVDAGANSLTTRALANTESWDVEAKMQWYHQEITRAGGRIWYKTMIAGALTEGNRVVGAVLCTPQGPIEVRATCVVDATGSATVAADAGAETVSIGSQNLAVQGTGLPGRTPGAGYNNTDYDFIDESNAADADSAFISAREKFKKEFDAGQLIDSRERRRVVGDYEITPMDIRLCRVFPDSVVKARSNFDTHGYTVHPLFMIVPPDHDVQTAFIPLRALLPKGLDGVLVTGLGISAHRDAMPVIRMQADVQNQGYAAGIIAAMTPNGRVRDLDIPDIQEHLVQKGILDPEIKGATDSFPLPETEIDHALANAPSDPNRIDRVFTLPDVERNQRLIQAYSESATPEARRFFAFVLGILGLDQGLSDLVKDVDETDWDKGWDYTGMGQFGASMSPLDARIIALGRCRNPKATALLAEKVTKLPPDTAFSHYRAIAEAFQTIGDPAAVPALENLLRRPGLSGHAITSTRERLAKTTENSTETKVRNASLIELHLATALHRLDPQNSLATDILTAYTHDLRGLFAAHARRILTNE
ncbi:MAG: FAD-dependent oxidoreductase [Kiritimatiellia bacterium]